MIIQQLQKQQLIQPPKWLANNTQYLCYIGSRAYGVETEDSDYDYYGFTVPPKDEIFPHLQENYIYNFGRQQKNFEVWQQAHIKWNKKEYDFQVFNIVRFFSLLMENNPNVLETLYVPINCVSHMTKVGQLVRDNKSLFLHKGVFHKMLAYAKSQIFKAEKPNVEPGSKRYELVQKHGFDSKFLYHTYRLVTECEQLLLTGDMDLQLYRESFKSIRRGEMKPDEVRKWFADKEKYITELYEKSNLPYGPDENKIRRFLVECLEHHYGSLDKAIVKPNDESLRIQKINKLAQEIQQLTEI